LRRLGYEKVEVRDGRVFFEADAQGIARANIWLRTAERVLIVLSEFPASTFDELFDGVKSVRWTDFIGRNDAFPVKGFCMNSKLTSVPACQSVAKKAAVTSLQAGYRTQELPENSGIEKKIRFALIKDVCALMLDTSGDGLHKRGYRPLRNTAPIRETLAAGIADLAHVKPDSRVCDPFCGSGTLVIESALRALNIAPGLFRPFAAERYGFIGGDVFARVRQEAREKADDSKASFEGRGMDIDPSAVRLARDNAERAHVGHVLRFETGDARKVSFSKDEILLANPPYGERISTAEESEELARAFGANIRDRQFRMLCIMSNHPKFEKILGMPADKRRKLYNGMMPCQLYLYQGSR